MTTETLPAIEFPTEEVTRIGPAEALRLGRLIRPVLSSGAPFRGDDTACAIGAMALGWGMPNPDNIKGSHDAQWQAYKIVESELNDPESDITDMIWNVFDDAEYCKPGSGDRAVLKYLKEKGL